MASLGTLKADIKSLSDFALQDIFDFIGGIMTLNSLTRNLPKDCREARFAKGEVCPHCKSTHVVKNGKLNDKQRYKCRDCNMIFNDFTKSALSCTNLPLEKWVKYAKCMVMGCSLRKSAENVEVCVKTSFYMRHKILDCIGTFMGTGDVDGVVEMDETFVAESFKGKVGYKDLERLYNGHIADESIICTDSHKSYIRLGRELNLDHKLIMRDHYKNGIYHINHVNSLHSQFKKWIKKFNGVSTKFLSNYLHWFKWEQCFKDDKDIIKSKNIIVQSTTDFVYTRIITYKGREPIFR